MCILIHKHQCHVPSISYPKLFQESVGFTVRTLLLSHVIPFLLIDVLSFSHNLQRCGAMEHVQDPALSFL